MDGDTDEQGWQYAARFGSRHWRGQPETWRSFVRRRRWCRARLYLPKSLPALIPGAKEPAPIDWEALHNSEFADRSTPSDNIGAPQPNEMGALGLKAATALLPLSPARKDDIFGWEQEIDAHQPFLAWTFVKYEGERALVQRRQRDLPGSRSDEELFGIWRDAVVEINYRKVARVLKGCRLDREKLGLWRWWLGLPVEPPQEGEEEQLYECETDTSRSSSLRAPNGRPGSGVDAKAWSEKDPRPMLDDVWDLLEGKVSSFHSLSSLFELSLTLSHSGHSSTTSSSCSSFNSLAFLSYVSSSPFIPSPTSITATNPTTVVSPSSLACSPPNESAVASKLASTSISTSKRSWSFTRERWGTA